MKRPLVSIVTPSYNQAAYLEETIRSVIGQDYEPIEYLIVDGASTDGSQAIIERYDRETGRIAWWVSEPDAGQSEAINKGLQRARGEIIAWLNSDDLYLPGAISQAVHALQAQPELGMVFGDAITIDAAGKPINKLTFQTPNGWDLAELLRFHIICQPAVFMRRGALEQVGAQSGEGGQRAPLDPDFHYMLDHHLWIRMAQQAPIAYIPTPWAAARHHAGAKNVGQAEGFGREILILLDWLQKQPDLRSLVDQDRRRVSGGAYRLNARYLLEGGLAGPALKSYLRAFFYWPRYTLRHWHRILYACLSFLKLGFITKVIDDQRANQSTRHSAQLAAELQNTQYKITDS